MYAVLIDVIQSRQYKCVFYKKNNFEMYVRSNHKQNNFIITRQMMHGQESTKKLGIQTVTAIHTTDVLIEFVTL